MTKCYYFWQTVGRGAFGIVQKAKWRGHIVAVKTIENEADNKEFKDEVVFILFHYYIQ